MGLIQEEVGEGGAERSQPVTDLKWAREGQAWETTYIVVPMCCTCAVW